MKSGTRYAAKGILISILVLQVFFLVTVPKVFGFTLYNGAKYDIDKNGDGSGENANDHRFELLGIALKVTQNFVTIALSTNMPLAGVLAFGQKIVGHGDILINPTSLLFKDAAANGKLWGIRFAASNESGVPNQVTGLFENVTPMTITGNNFGYASYNSNSPAYFSAEPDADLAAWSKSTALTELGPDAIMNVIQNTYPTLVKVADITVLNGGQVLSEGIDFNHFNALGTDVIGIQFSRNYGNGPFWSSGSPVDILYTMACGNDQMDYHDPFLSITSIPEIPGNGLLVFFAQMGGLIL